MKQLLISVVLVSAILLIACSKQDTTEEQAPSTSPLTTTTAITNSLANTSPNETTTITQRPLPPSIAAAKQMHTIKVVAGASSAEIIELYGQPTRDYWPENFNPQVRHVLEYQDQGLKFGLTRDKLSDIDATPNFQGEIFGLMASDPISRAIEIYGSGYITSESGTVEIGLAIYYHWEEFMPDWFVYVQNEVIVAFLMHNKSFYGSWSPN